MADFLVRIELDNAPSRDMRKVRDIMDEMGFRRYIRASDGSRSQLPSGEYMISGRYSANGLAQKVYDALRDQGLNPEILVSDVGDQVWYLSDFR